MSSGVCGWMRCTGLSWDSRGFREVCYAGSIRDVFRLREDHRELKGSFMSDEVLNVVPVEPAPAAAVKITVRPNGPFRVEGPISLVDVNGQEWDLTGKPAISLCRCGMSSKRPFCDGTHGREGWKCEASPLPTEPVALG
jgi:CDGSH-type Zn-finger protein